MTDQFNKAAAMERRGSGKEYETGDEGLSVVGLDALESNAGRLDGPFWVTKEELAFLLNCRAKAEGRS